MAKLLWEPTKEKIEKTNMFRFMKTVNEKYDQQFNRYPELWKWSVDNIPQFWEEMWDFGNIIASKPFDQAIDDVNKMPGAKWFPGARLNFAENLLRYRDDQTALVFRGEDQVHRSLTYAELYDEVARVAQSLRAWGLRSATGWWGSCPICPNRSSPCWPPPASEPPGLPAPPISASKGFWIASARSNPRCSLRPTATLSRAKN